MGGRLELLALIAALGACGQRVVASAPASPVEVETVVPAAGAAPPPMVASPRPISAPSGLMPRPYRGRLAAAVVENARCVSCHAREAAEWKASRHRDADTNPAYRSAFAVEPSPFCQGCHAPESDASKTPPKAVSDMGVGCVTCHVTEEGSVLAAEHAGALVPSAAPHAVQRLAEFAGTGACARCHEFAFPAPHAEGDGGFMQTTVREHARSPAAAKSCAACHMRASSGGRSHAFTDVRDPAWLRSRIEATAERTKDGSLQVTLVQIEPGHGFPTGDLFRRLEVGCESRDAQARVQARDVRHLARRFEILPYRSGRTLTRDDRVFDEPVVVELDCKAPERLSWWVTYQRVRTVGIGADSNAAKIESEVRLHAGSLP